MHQTFVLVYLWIYFSALYSSKIFKNSSKHTSFLSPKHLCDSVYLSYDKSQTQLLYD